MLLNNVCIHLSSLALSLYVPQASLPICAAGDHFICAKRIMVTALSVTMLLVFG